MEEVLGDKIEVLGVKCDLLDRLLKQVLGACMTDSPGDMVSKKTMEANPKRSANTLLKKKAANSDIAQD